MNESWKREISAEDVPDGAFSQVYQVDPGVIADVWLAERGRWMWLVTIDEVPDGWGREPSVNQAKGAATRVMTRKVGQRARGELPKRSGRSDCVLSDTRWLPRRNRDPHGHDEHRQATSSGCRMEAAFGAGCDRAPVRARQLHCMQQRGGVDSADGFVEESKQTADGVKQAD